MDREIALEQPVAAVRRPRRPRALSDPGLAFLLNAPSVLIILALVAYPIISSFWLSLHRWNLKRPNVFRFVWFQNYLDIFRDDLFWTSLRVTALFAFGSVLLIVALGTILALIVNEEFKGRGIVRAMVLIPWAIPPVVNGLLWQWIYNPKVGILNGLLHSLGIIGEYRSFLLDPNLAVVMLVLAHVWNNVPFAVIVLLAALQAIPAELYDAAVVDRAGAWQRFRHVTLPWLIHPLLIIMILQTMLAFRVFDLVYVLTGGGPGDATSVIAWVTWKTAFDYMDFGHGNAYAYVITLITMALAALYLRGLYARGEIRV